MDVAQINWLAVIAAAGLTFVLGGLWYSPVLFGKPWQRLCGLSDEDLKQASMAKVFGGSAACALVAATNLAFFLGPQATLGFGVGAGVAAGAGWVATAFITVYLFERRPFLLALIDGGYMAVAYALMGAVLGLWH